MTYRATFVARQVGAIGVTYPLTIEVEAASMPDAERELYKTYEHIQGLRFEVIE